MGLPPWAASDSQFFALITGANSGLGFSIAARMIEDFLTSPSTPPTQHLVLILCTRSPLKTRFVISRLRGHLRNTVEETTWAKRQKKTAQAQGRDFRWEDYARRVHFLGVEVDLCDLNSVYALADRLVNGTVGSPDATTSEGKRLPHGSPGTSSYSKDIVQDRWALSEEPGSTGIARSWGWGLSGIRVPRLDAILLTAGIGGWSGINWPVAVWEILTTWVEAITWPTFKLAEVGLTTKKQRVSAGSKENDETQPLLGAQEDLSGTDEPPLGRVFCANVFGHYILAHELMPLLSRPATSDAKVGGKIVWTSSLEPTEKHLNLDDIQGLESTAPYEASKRLMDILALTSELPSVSKASASFFDASDVPVKQIDDDEEVQTQGSVKPTMHLVHPGVFVSEIIQLNFVLVFLWTAAFYLARWVGSPWHTISPECASIAPAWLALRDQEELNKVEGNGQTKSKWGSAVDVSGNTRVMKTEVSGWGWNGKVGVEGDEGRKGRKRDAVELTEEAREDFEVQGGQVWTELEKLRKLWEQVLGVKRA